MLDSFSADYREARAKFIDALHAAGGQQDQVTHDARGPGGLDRSTDVGWFGDRNASKVLVLISGTHGVEGFFGFGRFRTAKGE